MSFLLRSIVRSTAILLLAALMVCSSLALGVDRKIKNRVNPTYPEIAKKSHVSGSVKLEVMVAADGSVKSVKAVGGHPMLIEAATSAVKMWKYEPGAESTVTVEIKFTLNDE